MTFLWLHLSKYFYNLFRFLNCCILKFFKEISKILDITSYSFQFLFFIIWIIIAEALNLDLFQPYIMCQLCCSSASRLYRTSTMALWGLYGKSEVAPWSHLRVTAEPPRFATKPPQSLCGGILKSLGCSKLFLYCRF